MTGIMTSACRRIICSRPPVFTTAQASREMFALSSKVSPGGSVSGNLGEF